VAAIPVNRAVDRVADGLAWQPVPRDPRIFDSLDNPFLHLSLNSFSLLSAFQTNCSPWNWPPAQGRLAIASRNTQLYLNELQKYLRANPNMVNRHRTREPFPLSGSLV
jgi:hypothetical protein